MSEPTRRQADLLTVALLIGSLGAVAIGTIGFGSMLVLGILQAGVAPLAARNAIVAAASALAMTALALPGLWLSGRALLGQPPAAVRRPARSLPLLLLFLLPPVLALGYLAFNDGILPTLLGPAAHLAAAGIPIAAALAYLLRRSTPISAERRWGQFLTGLWLSPPLSLFLELLMLVPIGLLVLLTPLFGVDLDPLFQAFANPANLTPEALDRLLLPLMQHPFIIGIGLAYLGLLVPLIEEALKSIALWPFISRGLTRSEGFLGGVLAGGGYALFEAFFLAQPNESWVVVMVARGGASLMHMLATGIVGLGIAEAASERRPRRALSHYAAAVTIHAVWNMAAVLVSADTWAPVPWTEGTPLSGPKGLGLLGLIFLSGLSLAAWLGLTHLAGKANQGVPPPHLLSQDPRP